MSFSVVIPARFGSTRLPGKPLLEINGKPMIQHVVERARASGAREVLVATDDPRIAQAVQAFGGEACLTAATHQSGTDRIAEVVEQRAYPDDHLVVNLQGDEPLMPPRVIRQVADNLAARPAVAMATVCARIESAEELFSPHVVKVVRDIDDMAIYFSRASIPWHRDAFAAADALPEGAEYFRHIGLYAYRTGFLRQFTRWEPCRLEQIESLEQLRALWHGHKIHVTPALEVPPAGVDTERDLEQVRRLVGRG